MKKKLVALLSLLSIATVATFGGVACSEPTDSQGSGTSASQSAPEESTPEESTPEESTPEESSPEESTEPEVKVPTLTISAETLALDLYASATLTATLENAEDEIVWASSNESVVKVVDGVVTAYKAGEATVTATAGALTASCAVTVSATEAVPEFNYLPENLELIKGTSEQLDVTLEYNGEEFTLATVVVSTEGDLVSVGEEYELTANAYGTQTVTVEAKIGDDVVASASIEVTVYEYGVILNDLAENKLDMTMANEGYDISGWTAMLNGVAVENPVFTITSANEEVAKGVDGKIVPIGAGETEVTVSFDGEQGKYDTVISVTVVKEVINKDVNFLLQGSNGKDVAETGTVTVDLAATGIDLSQVSAVVCQGAEVEFAVDGTNLTLTNAPGGYQYYTLQTHAADYIVDGCVYGMTISTFEELIDWRTSNYKAYAILTSDIDCEGATLADTGYMQGVIDGMGHTVSNFKTAKGFVTNVNTTGGVKNIQLINVWMDFSYVEEGSAVYYGVLGRDNMGVIENVVIKANFINVPAKDHYGVIYMGAHAGSYAKNVVAYITSDGTANHYDVPMWIGGDYTYENVKIVTNAATYHPNSFSEENIQTFADEESLISGVDFSAWTGWTTLANGAPCLTDYTEAEKNAYVSVSGKATVGATLTIDSLSLYPLTFALAEDVTGVSITENNEIVIGTETEVGAVIKLVASCEQFPDWTKTIELTVEKEFVQLEGVALAQGNGGKWSYDTGVATLDLSDKGADFTGATSVEIDGVAFESYTVDGGKLTVTNAPGGDHVYMVKTPATNYEFTGCVYQNGISTVEELETWRTTESYWYTVLLNDIDYEGETLAVGANVLGILDGRGYQIKNFTYTQGFVKNLYAAESVIKNVYFAGITQDCTGMGKYPTYGLFGQWTNGSLENIYVDVTTKLDEGAEHISTLCYGFESTATVKNIVLDIKNANGNFHYGVNQAKDGATVVGFVGAYEGANGSSQGGGAAWGVNDGFHQRLSWMVAEEANDELLTFTSRYWAIDTEARTITMKPIA